jgi:hypothetical protein
MLIEVASGKLILLVGYSFRALPSRARQQQY